MNKKPYNIPTILESCHNDVVSGVMTVEQAAEELCMAGWTNFVDVEMTKRLIKVN